MAARPGNRRRRTVKFGPDTCLPTDQQGSFGNGADLDWLPNPPGLPPGVAPAQAVAGAMWQHLVSYGIQTAMEARGWNLKEFAAKTPGIGYGSWDNVLNGRTLIRADHIGAAGLVFGSLGFLPPAARDADFRRAHRGRMATFATDTDIDFWDRYDSLQSGWEDVRRVLARPLHERDPSVYWEDGYWEDGY